MNILKSHFKVILTQTFKIIFAGVAVYEKRTDDTAESRHFMRTDHSYLETNNENSYDFNDVSVQTDLTMLDISALVQENNELKEKMADKTALLREAFVENVTKSDENVKKYTGFPSILYCLEYSTFSFQNVQH